MKASSIAVDLDGTLAKHTPGKFDPEVIGDPVPRMMSRVKRWLKDGEVVKIFTARAAQAKNISPIKKWLKQHGILGCEITNEKDPSMTKFLTIGPSMWNVTPVGSNSARSTSFGWLTACGGDRIVL